PRTRRRAPARAVARRASDPGRGKPLQLALRSAQRDGVVPDAREEHRRNLDLAPPPEVAALEQHEDDARRRIDHDAADSPDVVLVDGVDAARPAKLHLTPWDAIVGDPDPAVEAAAVLAQRGVATVLRRHVQVLHP